MRPVILNIRVRAAYTFMAQKVGVLMTKEQVLHFLQPALYLCIYLQFYWFIFYLQIKSKPHDEVTKTCVLFLNLVWPGTGITLYCIAALFYNCDDYNHFVRSYLQLA
jgi:hypothetical protein